MIGFKDYSLVLFKDGKPVFYSKGSGLKPLFECVNDHKGLKNCLLYDKVIGLAAARLILYSGMISSVMTNVCSIKAEELLAKYSILVKADKMVPNILNSDRTNICPMELSADKVGSEAFFLQLKERYLSN